MGDRVGLFVGLEVRLDVVGQHMGLDVVWSGAGSGIGGRVGPPPMTVDIS